ncbi:AAA family ATPase [Deltaproteobacteria bacterium OttesenSCG-928-K17]|nr:AAA family ATPase [Deltaproteobacteria bacterium OttesenSCG-928-K17]
MKIKFLHMENYRCFSDLKVNFGGQLAVLVGVNGSGKTAILDALALFLQMYAENFIHYPKALGLPSSSLKMGQSNICLSCRIAEDRLLSPTNRRNYFDATLKLEKNVMNDEYLKIDVNNNNFNVLGDFYKKNNIQDYFPICVYYTSKRVLDASERKTESKSNKMYAYGNAFSPQIDFSSALAWFISKASEEALEGQRRKNLEYKISELTAVRRAVALALGRYGEPFVAETPPKLFIAPEGQPTEFYRIEQLSDGYRTMLALVMDLARRMAIANDHMALNDDQAILRSPGVVLIDEVELHLHPSWQQTVLPRLMDIFPNVQFIVTTHSPQVLTSIPAKHIRVLKDGYVFTLPDNEETEGADAARILEDVLGVNPRPIPNYFARELNRYAEMVYNEKWDSPEAEELRLMLEKHYRGSEPKLQELELHIENSKWERGL